MLGAFLIGMTFLSANIIMLNYFELDSDYNHLIGFISGLVTVFYIHEAD